MVKMKGLPPLSEGSPVGPSVAGTLGAYDVSELGIGLPSCVTTTFLTTTHILVSGQGVQCINDLHCNVSCGQSCFLVHAREVPVSQAKKASADQGTREQCFGFFSRRAFQQDYTRLPVRLLCKTREL